MSKNHPHDNIYSILGKLEALQPTPQEKHDAVVKSIYESVEAQGSILKGLRDVSPIEVKLAKMFAESEENCNECGMCESDCSCEHEANESATRGPDTYGTSYYKTTDFTGGDEEKPAKRVVNKGVKGRPKKDAAPVYTKMNDPFGRVPDKAPKGKKGTFVKGAASESLREGINFAEMIKRKHQTVDEMLAELQADIKTFKDSGHCSDLLRDCMEVVSFGKDQIADEAVRPENIPAFQRKAAGKDFPVTTQQVNAPGDNISDIRNIRANTGRNPDTGTPNFRDDELNELARLAGVNVKEGTMNHGIFSDNENEANAAMDKLQGMESLPAGEASDMLYDIIFDDQLFDIIDDVAGTDPEQNLLDNPDFLGRLSELMNTVDEGNRFTNKLKDTPQGGEFELDGKRYRDTSSLEEGVGECSPMGSAPSQSSRLNVSTNMSSDGNKNVTVSAEGEQAEMLMQLLALAGMQGGSRGSDEGNEGELDEVSRGEYIKQQDAKAEKSGQDKFGAFGQEFDTDEVEENYANEPEEEYGTVDQITSQGDDMNRQKKQFKKEYPGDNPMTSESALALEAKLAAEYESIKKVTK